MVRPLDAPRRLWPWSIVLVLTVVAGACGGAQGQPPPAVVAAPTAAPATLGAAPPSAAPPLAPLRLRVMHSAVSGSQALLGVVQEAGLFTRQGLEVEVVSGTPRTASASLLAGESPIVVGSGAQLVATGLAGGDVVMVASAVNMMDTSIWTRDVADPAGLRGRRIGISVLGDSTDLAARFAARRWGLDPTTDLQIIQVGQPGERLAALEAGAVDATIIQPPQTVRARQIGLRKLAEMAELGMEYQHTGVLTTRGRIADEPALVDRFVRAWAEGLYYYGANPQQAREAVGHFMRLDDGEALEETYRHYRTLYVRPPYPTLQGIQSVLDAAVDEDPRAAGVRPETFVDTRFLDTLAAEGQFQTWEQQYRLPFTAPEQRE